jgi:5-methyltetrahydropteroyltriglutamate--homocysteine methyltransferase
MLTFKTTHVGSLPRPQQMMDKLLRKQAITPEELRACVSGIVSKQLSVGISCINNGELPRADYVTATVGRIAGFGGVGTAPLPRDLEELPEYARRFGGRNGLITLNPKAPVRLPACTEPLAYRGEASLREELDMLADAFAAAKRSYPETDADIFFTSPSPGTVALFMENQYYTGYDAYLEGIAAALKQEYDLISAYGFHLQIDCPDLAMGRHTRYKQLSDDAFLEIADAHVRVLNQALSDVAPDRCRAHVCWGNYPGTHHCDIDLETILSTIMNIKARFISLEAANHRHSHEWNAFARVPLPDDKVLMPGVIDTTSPIVEHPDLVAERLVRYAGLLGPERVIGSTDCGFATTASAASVSGEVVWLKLASLVEGARRAGRQFA